MKKEGKLEKAPARIEQNGIFVTDYPRMEGTYFSGGGGLSSTALDYAIFLQMMLNDLGIKWRKVIIQKYSTHDDYEPDWRCELWR